MDVKHQSGENKGEFYSEENGTKKGSVTYSKVEEQGIIIDHTEVSPELRNNNIGTELVEYVVQYARQHDLKVIPVCPFAKSVIKNDESLQDVVQEEHL